MELPCDQRAAFGIQNDVVADISEGRTEGFDPEGRTRRRELGEEDIRVTSAWDGVRGELEVSSEGADQIEGTIGRDHDLGGCIGACTAAEGEKPRSRFAKTLNAEFTGEAGLTAISAVRAVLLKIDTGGFAALPAERAAADPIVAGFAKGTGLAASPAVTAIGGGVEAAAEAGRWSRKRARGRTGSLEAYLTGSTGISTLSAVVLVGVEGDAKSLAESPRGGASASARSAGKSKIASVFASSTVEAVGLERDAASLTVGGGLRGAGGEAAAFGADFARRTDAATSPAVFGVGFQIDALAGASFKSRPAGALPRIAEASGATGETTSTAVILGRSEPDAGTAAQGEFRPARATPSFAVHRIAADHAALSAVLRVAGYQGTTSRAVLGAYRALRDQSLTTALDASLPCFAKAFAARLPRGRFTRPEEEGEESKPSARSQGSSSERWKGRSAKEGREGREESGRHRNPRGAVCRAESQRRRDGEKSQAQR